MLRLIAARLHDLLVQPARHSAEPTAWEQHMTDETNPGLLAEDDPDDDLDDDEPPEPYYAEPPSWS